ncbi:MAG: UDP-GlcNAc--UDP-phosphate GlcNAc-1-phosphate transferase [Paludibacter sp.]|jgi:UDP-N-acetylmuramyl pentapeptide phosphotransferase/UDP-N-acetylglucosamine-1-phosphate transferase|nr:UDP-GlcNAc--UDP-phosphate GlcNAc-1-phosphate transferase [Paludibacter sp.]
MIHLFLVILLIILAFGYFKIAEYFKIHDKPNERSSHHKATLLGGGVIFYFALLLYSFFFDFQYPWLLVGATVLAAVSFIDDLHPLSPRFRLVIHFVSLFILFVDLDLYTLSVPVLIVLFIVGVGLMNAYNFMDGINGMMGFTSMVVLLGMIYVNSYVIVFIDINLLYSLLLGVVIFNFFNFRTNAFCFAGDVGAFTIGLIMVFLIYKLIAVSGNFAWIALLAVFGVDTILTIIHRICLGENITRPHRKHLFQILANELKIPQLFISAGYGLVQVLVIIGLVVFREYSLIFAVAAIFVLSVFYILIKQKYYYLHCNSHSCFRTKKTDK